MTKRRGSWAGVVLAALVAITGALAALPARGAGAKGGADGLRSARETLEKWVQTRQLISEEKEEWTMAREVLQQRISLLEGELATLEKTISETRESLSESSGREASLREENEELLAVSESLGDVIVRLENRTKALLPRLPDELRDRLRPLARRLPEDPESSELSLGQRFQNVVGILNEADKQDRVIGVTSEVREIGDDTNAEVQVLHLGLAQAWYVTPDGSAAGVRRPSDEGWTWESRADIAADVTKALAILRNEDVPAWVDLPVVLR